MELASDLDACLRKLAASTSVEVRENGSRVATLGPMSWELRGAPAKPLLHLWSEQCNMTRRILAIADQSDRRLALAVERFGNPRPGRLEFLTADFVRPARKIGREEFCARLRRILAEQFPDEILESLSTAADLEHSLSGNYARGILRKGSTHYAVLAVPEGGAVGSSENSLSFGLLWLARVRETVRRGFVAGLRLIVNRGTTAIVAHHARALSSSVQLELYEHDLRRETFVRIAPNSFGNLQTWLVTHREKQSLLHRAASQLDPIVASAPQAITVHPNVHLGEVVLRFRGLAFTRWDDGKVFFGIGGDLRQKLTAASQPDLNRLLKELDNYRHPLASNTRHPRYRAQSERWLETIVRNDVTRVDASLDPRFVYTQLFANSSIERGILDVLTVTRSGRLAIIELKAAEHIHLPLQAADYWLRIRHHLQEGDFQRHGYFTEIQLQNAPPIVYLVAPALRFHPTTGALLRQLSPEMEIVRVGVAESWRGGLRVVMRQ
jgi:hypothetical protein